MLRNSWSVGRQPEEALHTRGAVALGGGFRGDHRRDGRRRAERHRDGRDNRHVALDPVRRVTLGGFRFVAEV